MRLATEALAGHSNLLLLRREPRRTPIAIHATSLTGAFDALRQSANSPTVVGTMLSHVVRCRRRFMNGMNLLWFPWLIQTRSDCRSEHSAGTELPSRQKNERSPSSSVPTRPCCIHRKRRNRPNQAGKICCRQPPEAKIRARNRSTTHRGPLGALAKTGGY